MAQRVILIPPTPVGLFFIIPPKGYSLDFVAEFAPAKGPAEPCGELPLEELGLETQAETD